MENAWENISLNDYEKHMSSSEVKQLQTLNSIMKSQLNDYDVSSAAILGVAGGNGLEHIDSSKLKRVYGIDINQNYINKCRERYSYFKDIIILEKMDLSDIECSIPNSEIIIANLIIEYIGLYNFVQQIKKVMPKYISCVIQKNIKASFVSNTKYESALKPLESIHSDIEKDALIKNIENMGYYIINDNEYGLPNSKKFIRVDFKIKS